MLTNDDKHYQIKYYIFCRIIYLGEENDKEREDFGNFIK